MQLGVHRSSIFVLGVLLFGSAVLSAGNYLGTVPSIVPVRELVESKQARFSIVSREVRGERTDIQLVLVDQENKSVGGYAPPYLATQAEARELWKDFVTANLSLPAQPEAMTITETRASENESFAVGFALDHSQSMTMPRAVRMQRAIQAALQGFDPNDYVSIVKFTGSPKVEVPLSNDKEFFRSKFKVDGLSSRGNGSAIYDAALVTIEQLAKAPSASHRIMILFTDGEDVGSSSNYTDVIEFAQRHNVVIHAVTFGVSNESALLRIAESTSGRLHRLSDIYDFDRVFLGIYNSLRHSYSIVVKLNSTVLADASQGATMTAAVANGKVKTSDVLAMMPNSSVHIANNTDDNTLIVNLDLKFMDQSHIISPSDVPVLDSIATILIQRKDLALEILNNTENGENLGQLHRRSNAVRDMLIRRGVPPSRIQSYSGKTSAANPVFRYADPKKTTFVFSKL